MTLWSKFKQYDEETHTWMNIGHGWKLINKIFQRKFKKNLKWRLHKTYSAYQTLYMDKINDIQLCGQTIDIEWHQMKFLTQINRLHVLNRMF
jgi:hypothetical protein